MKKACTRRRPEEIDYMYMYMYPRRRAAARTDPTGKADWQPEANLLCGKLNLIDRYFKDWQTNPNRDDKERDDGVGAHEHRCDLCKLVELSENLVRMRTGADGWRICPASLEARVPGKLTLDRLM